MFARLQERSKSDPATARWLLAELYPDKWAALRRGTRHPQRERDGIVNFDFTPGRFNKPYGKEATHSQSEQTTASDNARTFDRGPGSKAIQRTITTASAIREAGGAVLAGTDRGRGIHIVGEQATEEVARVHAAGSFLFRSRRRCRPCLDFVGVDFRSVPRTLPHETDHDFIRSRSLGVKHSRIRAVEK
jgi:hypothetical protein